MALEGYSKLNLEVSDNGTILKWENQAVSLQKQVRYLRQELSNTSYNDAQRQSVRLLLADAQIGLQATQTRSRELFGTLSLLPGAMGNFFGTVQMTLVALRELSQLSFSDLKSQFQILQSTFTGEKLGNFSTNSVNTQNGTQQAIPVEPVLPANTIETAEGSALGGIAAQKSKETADAIKEETNAKKGLVSVNGVLMSQQQAMLVATRPLSDSYKNQGENQKLLEESYRNLSFEVVNHKNLISQIPYATREVTQEEKNLLRAYESNIILEGGMVKALQEVTLWQKVQVTWWNLTGAAMKAYDTVVIYTTGLLESLGLAFNVANIAAKGLVLTVGTLGIGALVVGLGALTAALYEMATGTAKADAEMKQLGVDVEENTKFLADQLGINKRFQEEYIAQIKSRNASEHELRQQNIKDAHQNLNTINEAYETAVRNRDIIEQRVFAGKGGEKGGEIMKKANEEVLKLQTERNNAIAKINIDGYQRVEEEMRRAYANNLRDLDARIEKEIYKENTSKTELENLYKKRNKLVDDYNVNIQLSETERAERTKNDRIKVNNAIIDDTVRRLKAEQDVSKRMMVEAGKDSEDYFIAKRAENQKQFEIEMAEAGREEKTRITNEKNARTKFYQAGLDIDKEELQAKINLQKLIVENDDKNTKQQFEEKRTLENKEFELRVANARGQYKILEQLRKEHSDKLKEIDDEEMTYKASLEKRKSETEQENFKVQETNFFKSYHTVTQMNKRKFDDLREEEQYNYEVAKDKAEGNTKELEEIELEHAARMRQIKAQEFETNRQLDLMTLEATQSIGTSISTVGDALMQAKQGRDKAAFESGKRLAVAGIVIEKASAIGQIWENNAIANSKAIATFWETGGQPWVTLNTIQAGFATAATVASAASAISQINGTDFQQPNFSGRGLGKNYGQGGIINGASHAQGGVPINAEGGEAVMSRGAVTMFAPLLSLMNQAGGGTSFNQGAMGGARYDAPKSIGGPMEQPIIKTYVVEGDLTTAQHKAARLKSLSTL